jgi:acetyl-CoA carboxylase carboxyltransferase component
VTEPAATPERAATRTRALAAELVVLRQRLRLGGGGDRAEKQHQQGKLTARERVALLLDDGEPWVEIGLLVAHDRYEGQAPAAGVVTGVGRVHGRELDVDGDETTVKHSS